MRRHLEIANLVRERDGQWRRLADGFCALLQELPDGGDMHGVSGDGLGLLDRDRTPGVVWCTPRCVAMVPIAHCSTK